MPADAQFEHDEKGSLPCTISSGYNAVAILVSIGQLLFASSTPYRSRGNQIDLFGYAAFGLTVVQYALMSLLNLLGNLICPQYPTLYLVESRAMREAQAVPGAVLEGTVGKLLEDGDGPLKERSQAEPDWWLWRFVGIASRRDHDQIQQAQSLQNNSPMKPWWYYKRNWRQIPLALVPTAISLAIIGSLSHFRRGSSTHA